jgi:hypothetical protein
VHALPVMSELAVLAGISTLFISLHTPASASAHDVAATSMMMSTPC